MLLKDIVLEDFTNYKLPSMFLIFPFCSFKCDKENHTQICQNWNLTKAPTKYISINYILDKYKNNPITKSLVMGGLEPLDSWEDLVDLLIQFRKISNDDIIIYTGYKEEEIKDKVIFLQRYKNIIIKFGRFVPNEQPRYDEILGINLASNNQYARRIS